MLSVRVVASFIILVNVMATRGGDQITKVCQDPGFDWKVGMRAVVAFGIKESSNGYQKHNHFMGVVGCSQKEGQVCLEGVSECFDQQHVHRVSSVASTLHTISFLAWIVEVFLKDRNLRWLPLTVVSATIDSKLVLTGAHYTMKLTSTSDEAIRYRKYMFDVRSRLEMLAFMDPRYWRWTSHAFKYTADTSSGKYYLSQIIEVFQGEVDERCVRDPGSDFCSDLKEDIHGLGEAAAVIFDMVDDTGVVDQETFERAVGYFVNSLSTTTGRIAALDMSIGDFAFGVFALVRQSVGRSIVAVILRQPTLKASLTSILAKQKSTITYLTARFEKGAHTDIGQGKKVSEQVSLMLGFLANFLDDSKDLMRRRVVSITLDLLTIVQALRTYHAKTYVDKINNVFFNHLFAAGTELYEGFANVRDTLNELFEEAKKLRNAAQQATSESKMVAENSLGHIRRLTRELTKMAVVGAATGSVRNEVVLV